MARDSSAQSGPGRDPGADRDPAADRPGTQVWPGARRADAQRVSEEEVQVLRADGRTRARAGDPARVSRWHVVRQDQHTALCAVVLTSNAGTLAIADPHPRSTDAVCPACWACYGVLL